MKNAVQSSLGQTKFSINPRVGQDPAGRLPDRDPQGPSCSARASAVKCGFVRRSLTYLNLMPSGFTLIELLVVVLIIGILAAVALPQYQKAVEKALAVEALTNMASLQRAVDVWQLANPSATDTDLLGNWESSDGRANLLDVDVESTLVCAQGESYCHSKYFAYDVNCWDDGDCSIQVIRCQDGDCSSFKSPQYALEMYKQNGVWKKYCEQHSNFFPFSKTLCQSLVSQGFECSNC